MAVYIRTPSNSLFSSHSHTHTSTHVPSPIASKCSLPQYSKHSPLKNSHLAQKICETKQKQPCPNGNILCSLLANLAKEEHSCLMTVCSCIGYQPSTIVSVPHLTTHTSSDSPAKKSSSTRTSQTTPPSSPTASSRKPTSSSSSSAKKSNSTSPTTYKSITTTTPKKSSSTFSSSTKKAISSSVSRSQSTSIFSTIKPSTKSSTSDTSPSRTSTLSSPKSTSTATSKDLLPSTTKTALATSVKPSSSVSTQHASTQSTPKSTSRFATSTMSSATISTPRVSSTRTPAPSSSKASSTRSTSFSGLTSSASGLTTTSTLSTPSVVQTTSGVSLSAVTSKSLSDSISISSPPVSSIVTPSFIASPTAVTSPSCIALSPKPFGNTCGNVLGINPGESLVLKGGLVGTVDECATSCVSTTNCGSFGFFPGQSKCNLYQGPVSQLQIALMAPGSNPLSQNFYDLGCFDCVELVATGSANLVSSSTALTPTSAPSEASVTSTAVISFPIIIDTASTSAKGTISSATIDIQTTLATVVSSSDVPSTTRTFEIDEPTTMSTSVDTGSSIPASPATTTIPVTSPTQDPKVCAGSAAPNPNPPTTGNCNAQGYETQTAGYLIIITASSNLDRATQCLRDTLCESIAYSAENFNTCYLQGQSTTDLGYQHSDSSYYFFDRDCFICEVNPPATSPAPATTAVSETGVVPSDISTVSPSIASPSGTEVIPTVIPTEMPSTTAPTVEPTTTTAPPVCPSTEIDCGRIPGSINDYYSQFHSGSQLITGPDYSGNTDPIGHPPFTTNLDAALSKCDAATQCAQLCTTRPNDYFSFDLHYERSQNAWVCVQWYDPNTAAGADFHYPDVDAQCVYGFSHTFN